MGIRTNWTLKWQWAYLFIEIAARDRDSRYRVKKYLKTSSSIVCTKRKCIVREDEQTNIKRL